MGFLEKEPLLFRGLFWTMGYNPLDFHIPNREKQLRNLKSRQNLFVCGIEGRGGGLPDQKRKARCCKSIIKEFKSIKAHLKHLDSLTSEC